MKTIFLAGWISPVSFREPGWIGALKEKVTDPKSENFEFVLFRLPKDKNNNANNSIIAVESFLQEKFPEVQP